MFLTSKPSVLTLKLSSFMPSHFSSIEITEVHGLSPSLILYFNSSKFHQLNSIHHCVHYCQSCFNHVCLHCLTQINQVMHHPYHQVLIQVWKNQQHQTFYFQIVQVSSSSDIPSIIPSEYQLNISNLNISETN